MEGYVVDELVSTNQNSNQNLENMVLDGDGAAEGGSSASSSGNNAESASNSWDKPTPKDTLTSGQSPTGGEIAPDAKRISNPESRSPERAPITFPALSNVSCPEEEVGLRQQQLRDGAVHRRARHALAAIVRYPLYRDGTSARAEAPLGGENGGDI